jgi:hypothetical protein
MSNLEYLAAGQAVSLVKQVVRFAGFDDRVERMASSVLVTVRDSGDIQAGIEYDRQSAYGLTKLEYESDRKDAIHG